MMWYQNVEIKYEQIKDAFVSYLLYCTNNGYKPVAVGKFQLEYNRLKKGF